MNNVNKTLYIPLYGKAYVSRKGIIPHGGKGFQDAIWRWNRQEDVPAVRISEVK